VIVLLLGRFYGGVHLAMWKWFAIFGVIWIGAMAFTALAVAIGYRFAPDTVQPIAMVIYLLMSVVGGLYFAVTGVLGTIGTYVPTYQVVRIGTDIMAGKSIPAIAFIVIAAWFAAFLTLAIVSVRASAETV
jgi:ABC-2 type transport system permease protein